MVWEIKWEAMREMLSPAETLYQAKPGKTERVRLSRAHTHERALIETSRATDNPFGFGQKTDGSNGDSLCSINLIILQLPLAGCLSTRSKRKPLEGDHEGADLMDWDGPAKQITLSLN